MKRNGNLFNRYFPEDRFSAKSELRVSVILLIVIKYNSFLCFMVDVKLAKFILIKHLFSFREDAEVWCREMTNGVSFPYCAE
jgi:hypothetical protein